MANLTESDVRRIVREELLRSSEMITRMVMDTVMKVARARTEIEIKEKSEVS